MTIEYVRSCHSGFWRFFAARPDVITPGRYFFVPDRNPHLSDYHFFGCQDWQQGDVPDIVGQTPNVTLGNVKSLGWDWDNGKAPSVLPPPGFIGNINDFAVSEEWPVPFDRQLIGGVDSRCYLIPAGFLLGDFRQLADDNCAWLLILCGIIEKMESGDKATVEAVLRLIFGLGTIVDFRDPEGSNNMICVAQTPRNNIVIVGGTHSWSLFAHQFLTTFNGPTEYPTISTLPLWWDAATVVADFMTLVGADLSKPTLLSGHSMGAATVMVLWHRMLAAEPTRDVHVITFGMPKPGDQRLADHWERAGVGISVVNHLDYIPHYPPSNVVQAAIQHNLPFVPDAWFGQFIPLSRYLFVDAGGTYDYREMDDLNVSATIGFIVFGLFFAEPEVGASHRMPSYIRHLLLHCPNVELPFNADVYDLLFGHHQFDAHGGPEWGRFGLHDVAFGGGGIEFGGEGLLEFIIGDRTGIAFGGEGNVPYGTIVRVLLGGAGDRGGEPMGLVFGGEGVRGAGLPGFELGGGGDLGGEPMGLVFGGEGDMPVNPGADCDHAKTLTLGSTFNYTTSTTQAQWYKVPITNGTLYHLRITPVSWLGFGDAWYHGGSCSSKSSIGGAPSSITPCVEYTATATENLYIEIGTSFFSTINYDIVVDTGHC